MGRLLRSRPAILGLAMGLALYSTAIIVTPVWPRLGLVLAGLVLALPSAANLARHLRRRRMLSDAATTAQIDAVIQRVRQLESNTTTQAATTAQIGAVIQRVRQLEGNTTSVGAHTALASRLDILEERVDRLRGPAVRQFAPALATRSGSDKRAEAAVDEVRIGDISLLILGGNNDRRWYQNRGVFEERSSRLYPMVDREGYVNFVDIGANYGFVSILAAQAAPAIRVIALEADPRLVPLIHSNLTSNGVTDALVLNAIVGDTDRGTASFSLNPSSTLDNRVDIAEWEHQEVPVISIDELDRKHRVDGRTFIKIDTQGHEHKVLVGAEGFLTSRDDWLIKMEFGPDWLRSQSTSPIDLLEYLTDRYDVAESPLRMPYSGSKLESCFDRLINGISLTDYIAYVESLNIDQRGWVDLLVRPRSG